MAEGKSSFILYSDTLHTVRILSDEQAGKLFKTILEYVNDEDPEPADPFVKIAFEPIKQQLKRDLKYWEQRREKRSEAGKVGGLRSGEVRSKTKQNEAIVHTMKQNEANEAVTVNGTVTVNVNDNVILSIERCGEIALADPRWVKANRILQGELQKFNEYLEQQGKYEMNPLDYKTYFAKLKGRYPDLLKKNFTVEELRELAKQQDLINERA